MSFTLYMDYIALRALFDYLCTHFEGNSEGAPFVFEGGLDLETPEGSMMMFMFDKMTVICRFREGGPGRFAAKQPVSTNECLDMLDEIRDTKGGFEALFNKK